MGGVGWAALVQTFTTTPSDAPTGLLSQRCRSVTSKTKFSVSNHPSIFKADPQSVLRLGFSSGYSAQGW